MATKAEWRDRASDSVQEAVDAIVDAEDEDVSEEEIAAYVEQFEQNVGIPLEDLDDAWAEDLRDAVAGEDDPAGALRSYLMNNPPQPAGNTDTAASSATGSDGDSADASSGGGSGPATLTDTQREEVAHIVRQESPDANEIARKITSEMGGGSGGGGGGGSGAQDQLAMAIAQKFLQGGGGGGLSEEMQEMQNQAFMSVMEGATRRLSQPSFGEKIGTHIEDRAAQAVANELDMDLDFGENGGSDGTPFVSGDDEDGDDEDDETGASAEAD